MWILAAGESIVHKIQLFIFVLEIIVIFIGRLCASGVITDGNSECLFSLSCKLTGFMIGSCRSPCIKWGLGGSQLMEFFHHNTGSVEGRSASLLERRKALYIK